MPYDEQTWANGRDGGTPTSAARFNHMEQGISAAMTEAEKSPTIAQVTGLQAALNGKAATSAIPSADRLVPEGGSNGNVLKMSTNGMVWAEDTNTTYPALTAAAAETGTATTASTISVKVLTDEIDRRVAAAVAAALNEGEATP